MINLSIFFFVQHVSSSITLAGIATGTATVTSSLTAGLRGSTIDRFGQTRPLSMFIPAWVVCVLILSRQTSVSGIVATCFVLGLCSPPINLSTRPLWREIVPETEMRTAYAIDTTLLNSTSVIGPVIATRVALHWEGQTALTTTAALMALGGLLMITMPLSRRWVPEARDRITRTLFVNRQFQILAIEGMVFGMAWGLLEISIPAMSTLNHKPELAAPLLACLAGSSVIGGLIIGGRKANVTPLAGFRASSAFVALAALPLALTTPGPTMIIALTCLGLAIGFAQVYHWEVLEAVRPPGTATTAQAWLWTVEGSMMAAGTALGGYIVEHISATVAFSGVTIGLIASTSFIWLYASPRLQKANQPISLAKKVEALADTETASE
jgi:MFS family permease